MREIGKGIVVYNPIVLNMRRSRELSAFDKCTIEQLRARVRERLFRRAAIAAK
jgi:hypothetical protein